MLCLLQTCFRKAKLLFEQGQQVCRRRRLSMCCSTRCCGRFKSRISTSRFQPLPQRIPITGSKPHRDLQLGFLFRCKRCWPSSLPPSTASSAAFSLAELDNSNSIHWFLLITYSFWNNSMFKKFALSLLSVAALAVSSMMFSSLTASPPTGPCACCGELCACVDCFCDAGDCQCDVGGQCACSSDCCVSAGCCLSESASTSAPECKCDICDVTACDCEVSDDCVCDVACCETK